MKIHINYISPMLIIISILSISISCKKDEKPVVLKVPVVETAAVTNIDFFSATSGGNITNDGGSAITTSGICWSTNVNPTIADSHTTDGTTTGSFTSNMTNLNSSTNYHVRAYATNSIGTSYGNDISFVTPVDK